tara:strand:- start:86 stop:391 length:306 start_codon:yes stop_codon:yes gene_type:complete
MEYTNIIYPLLSIFLTLTIGIIIGIGVSFYRCKEEINALNAELDTKDAELEGWTNNWKNKYDDDDDDSMWYSCCGIEMTGILEDIRRCPKCGENTEPEDNN